MKHEVTTYFVLKDGLQQQNLQKMKNNFLKKKNNFWNLEHLIRVSIFFVAMKRPNLQKLGNLWPLSHEWSTGFKPISNILFFNMVC